MDMTKYIVYLGDKEVDYIYLGDKEIDYHQESEAQVGVDNIWIIQADGNYDRTVPVCNLTVTSVDGTIATADDVEYVYVFKRFMVENVSGSSATLVCNTSQNIDKVDQFGKRLTNKSEFENLFNDTGILLQSGNHKGGYDGYVIKFKKKIDFTSASVHIKHTGVNRCVAISYVPEPEGDIYRARRISTNQYTTAFDIIDFGNNPKFAAPVTGVYTAMAPVTVSITRTPTNAPEPVKLKSIWINTFGPDDEGELYFRNVKLYRSDGTIIDVGEISKGAAVCRDTPNQGYNVSYLNIPQLINSGSGNGANIYYWLEIGVFLTFVKEEPISRVVVDIITSDGTRRVSNIEISKVVETNNLDKDLGNATLLFRKEGFTIQPTWGANTIIDATIPPI